MVRALVLKELKESAWIWLTAAAAYAILALDVMRVPLLTGFARRLTMGYDASVSIPFVNSQIAQGLGCITGAFAICLGVWQSFGETWRGTFPLLLHVPMARKRLVAWKVILGVALALGLPVLALLAMSLWAAMPGTHASPFEWSMTEFCWRICFTAPLFYLGGFVTGLYPAHWLGTRLFPLLLAALIVAMLLIASEAHSLPLWIFAIAILAAEGAFIIVLGRIVRTRDFA